MYGLRPDRVDNMFVETLQRLRANEESKEPVPPPTWPRLAFYGLVAALIALVALLWLVPGGTP